MTVTQDITFNW